MFAEEIKKIVMEGVKQNGWLDSWLTEREEIFKAEGVQEIARKIARKLLLHGMAIDDVANVTELPLDTVIAIANQLQELPAGV